jgi:hypothetical protein
MKASYKAANANADGEGERGEGLFLRFSND